MGSQEVENVCNYLKNKHIQMSPNNLWLSRCINWYNSHLELNNVYGSLEEYVCIQWLLADLQDVQCACLPTNCTERVVHINGKYSVQINWIRDIGQSCYSQLQNIQHLDEFETYTSEDEPKKQNWEPKQKRVLMMEITDGITTLKAMEYSLIPKLFVPFLPGTKVVLSGPIECRNGILLLKNDNISLLGGEVERLYKKHSLETLLSRCLNLVNGNEIEEAEMDNVVPRPHSTHPVISLSSNVPPNLTSIGANGVSVLDRSNLMLDEEDEFLRELPDEVLVCPENSSQGCFQPSPVLEVRAFENNRQAQRFDNQITTNEAPSIISKPLRMNKPKLFPSLEDLQLIGRESSSNAHGTASSSTPLKSTDTSLNNSFGSSTSLNHLVMNNTITNQHCDTQNIDHSSSKRGNREINMRLCDEEYMDFAPNNDNYPQSKKFEVKIDSITKLKIRNGEWVCCASAVIENQLVNITFSNEVLETLFGIPATEVEVWRGEMSTNTSLKKKVNDILKAGQTKLKILKCPMTLEYSSEDCTPTVVAIHML